MNTVGVFSTVEGISSFVMQFEYGGGYHDTCGGYIQYCGGTQITKDCIRHGTEHPPRYSTYLPVLMISPRY